MTNDGLGGTFAFDGENRSKTAGSVTYTYDDADGRRIQKSTGINYWYGPGGQVLAETDASGNWTNYIFFGGRRLARNVPQTPPAQADIKYYITDHLNSTAMFVDQAGTAAAILDDNDMYPWGGVVPGVGKTTSNNTIKFTGQYRDTETTANLDYFGARYYSNTVGRFASPDWAAKPTSVPYAKFGDPQSLNLYSYVENNPINRIDPDGHFNDPFGTFSDGDTGYSNIQSVSFTTKFTITKTTYVKHYSDGTATSETITTYKVTDISLAGTSDASNDTGEPRDHFASVSDYFTGAGGFGHTGIAVDSDDTQGFSTANPRTPWYLRLFWAPIGGTEDDLVQHTDQTTNVVAPHSYIHIPITAGQAKEMQAAIDNRSVNPGRYNLIFRNCTGFVESVLHAGGVSGVPHAEIFGPHALNAILWYENTFR